MAYTLMVTVTARRFCGGEIALALTSQTVEFLSRDAAVAARLRIEQTYSHSSDENVKVILLEDTK
jgi:hypothetical protein